MVYIGRAYRCECCDKIAVSHYYPDKWIVWMDTKTRTGEPINLEISISDTLRASVIAHIVEEKRLDFCSKGCCIKYISGIIDELDSKCKKQE